MREEQFSRESYPRRSLIINPFLDFDIALKIFPLVYIPVSAAGFRYTKAYTCAPAVITKYQKRSSGPLLDCIYTHIEVPLERFNQIGNAAGTST